MWFFSSVFSDVLLPGREFGFWQLSCGEHMKEKVLFVVELEATG